MACKGPQGIRPFNKPIINGEPLPFFGNIFLRPLGSLGASALKNEKEPIRFSAIIIIKAPAMSCIIPLTTGLILNALPSAPTMPPVTV